MPARVVRNQSATRAAVVQPRRAACGALLVGLVGCLRPVLALDAIHLEARAVVGPGLSASNVRAQLELPPARAPRLSVRGAKLDLGERLGTFRDISLRCEAPVVLEPRYACPGARFAAASSVLGPVNLRLSVEYRSDHESLSISGVDLPIVQGSARFEARLHSDGWSIDARVKDGTLQALRSLAGARVRLPADVTLDGAFDAHVIAQGSIAPQAAQLDMQLRKLNLTNTVGSIVAENVGLQLHAELRRGPAGPRITARLSSQGGQALAGPVLLDFNEQPLAVESQGVLGDGYVDFASIRVDQSRLLTARGNARVSFAEEFLIERAQFAVERLQFPAAYTSLLQLALAGSDFGTLATTGIARGEIEVTRNMPTRLQLELDDLTLLDEKKGFAMRSVTGTLHWLADAGAEPPGSHIAWSSGGAYGLSGDAARLDFRLRGADFELTRRARIPVFDGALLIDTLTARNLGREDLTIVFEAEIAPISLPRLSRAFGWPELAGRLSGKIPRVEYRDKLLTFTGDVVAQVFDGRIVGSNMRLQDPLGPWPRFFADVRAQNLDLALVTNTFSIGTMTGRLEGQVLGLELFNWSPVAFNAAFYTPASDRTRRRMSARAVGNLSNIGGGGGGVTKALQSGAFRMFDQYDYDQFGIRCKLRDEVCLMSGVEPAGGGYYIVKGKGLPRINIIGNAGRVNWPQLVSQIATQMRGEGKLLIK
jgi:hypothetical protein